MIHLAKNRVIGRWFQIKENELKIYEKMKVETTTMTEEQWDAYKRGEEIVTEKKSRKSK